MVRTRTPLPVRTWPRPSMLRGTSAQQWPPFAYGNDTASGDWGVIVHHMFNRDDYDEIDYRELCPQALS